MFNWLRKLSSHFKKDGNFFLELRELTGIIPKNEEYYKLALRHSSASHEGAGSRINNQRLEYLGDAILGAVVADFLYENYPKRGEGFLTSMRSKIVSRKHLNQLGLELNLHKLVVKRTARTAHAKSIYGDALEALLGALYLDKGYEETKKFIIERIILTLMDLDSMESRIASHKGAILEWGQKSKKSIRFDITGCWGESHLRRYEITLIVDNEAISTGNGSSKKKAEEEASRIAYKQILRDRLNGQDSAG